MPKNYLNLDLPPGIRSNGTEYSNRGVWIDGSRVRWSNNAVRPIGGWARVSVNGEQLPALYADPEEETARSLAVWKTNSGESLFAAGTNKKLYVWDQVRQGITDITPLDFVPRDELVHERSDTYGSGYYGTGAYGVEREHVQAEDVTFNWTFRNWGQNLLAAPQGFPSRLYEWDTNIGNRAVPVEDSPENFDCFHVTDQRIVMVAGDPSNPRIIKWSDSENMTDWQPRPNNRAGFQQLPGVGRFRAIVTLQDVILLVSETDAYVCRYVGGSFVYGFDQLGNNCGTPSPSAVVATNSFVIWPGLTSFFISDGNAVERIECDVIDKFSSSLNKVHASKTTGFVNPFWPEVWWLYQEGQNDVDSYIYYNWQSRHWGYGKLNRTVGGGYSTFGGLVMISPEGEIYSHELDNVLPIDNDPSEIYLTSGPIELTKGTTTQYIRSIQPDFNTEGQVAVSIIGRDRPTAPETSFGPFLINYPATTNQPVAVKARGHTIKVNIEGRRSSWRLGSMRLDFAGGGER